MNENEIKKSSALESVAGFLKNNSMVLIFLVLAVFLGVSSGNSLSSLGADASSRFFRNIFADRQHWYCRSCPVSV